MPGATAGVHPQRERLFFGVWPSRAVASTLHAIARRRVEQSGGKLTRADSIHLTLVFLGEVPAGQVGTLQSPPAALAGPAFDLRIDGIGHWVRNGIAWAAPTVVPEALVSLQSRLSGWVAGQGIAVDDRPFRPHVTLIRKAARTVSRDAIEPVAWRVDEYVLVRSRLGADGSRYESIGRFPLNRHVGNPS